MPSVGHVIVGLAAGRWYARAGGPRGAASATFVVLSTFQDLDFLARRLGAATGSPWLHRGALHALSTAALAGLLAALLLGGLGRSRPALALTGALVAASHGLLDTLTGGGAGVMLLWPAATSRFLSPWTWMPAAPMGLGLASSRGGAVVLRELLVLWPLLLYAAWPTRDVGRVSLAARWVAEAGGRRSDLPLPPPVLRPEGRPHGLDQLRR